MKNITKSLLPLGFLAVVCLSAGVALGAPLNPDFETGDFTDWGFVTMDGVVADNGPSAAGSFAASMTIALPQGFEQAVAKATPITPGDLLDFSFDFKTEPNAVGNFHVQLRYWDGVGANGFSDGGGGAHKGEHTVTLSPTNGEWMTTTLLGLPYPDGSNAADYVDIRVIGNAFGAFEGTALVDNFNINVPRVPEPATFSLLCLGGLAMLLRRRQR